MPKCSTFLFTVILLFSLDLGDVLAQQRELLYSKSASGKLQEITETIRNFKTAKKIPYNQLIGTTDYFVRIASRGDILTGNNEVGDNAYLGGKPFVFITTPESIYGRSLLEIYEDIGYTAREILRWQRNEDMVAIVFRFPDGISVSNIRDGRLPTDWSQHVYIPTWDNVFALFHQLASAAAVKPFEQIGGDCEKMSFQTEADKSLVLSFPAKGRERIKATGYCELKAIKGPEWEYREILEKQLYISEHFTGNGRTHNEMLDSEYEQPMAGLYEFLGPNSKIRDLPEVAIVHLGRLTIGDTYSPPGGK